MEPEALVVNVGGVRLALHRTALRRFPHTRLGQILQQSESRGPNATGLCDDYDAVSDEYYFDRDPQSFNRIVELYYFGQIHMERAACPACFKQEMDFWKIDVDYLDECCCLRFYELKEELDEILHRVQLALEDASDARDGSKWSRTKRWMWRTMEQPESSALARATTLISFMFVIISSVVMCLGTIPELQIHGPGDGETYDHPVLNAIETACMSWFSLEFLIRLTSAPNRFVFVFTFLNAVDLLTVLPFLLTILLSVFGSSFLELSTMRQVLQVLRIIRIARIFKLARHSSGLQTLTYALRRSFAELGLLIMYMSVGIFIFSTLGYTLEQSHPETLFSSIPHAFWWAIITMTTVGYGDVYPKTELGKVNAAVSFLCGILAIALPIHPIINNFVCFYNQQKVLDTAVKHQLTLMTMALHPQSVTQAIPAAVDGDLTNVGILPSKEQDLESGGVFDAQKELGDQEDTLENAHSPNTRGRK
uniref:potassium voltage-gated channel subfamily F member 1-like n=1 Tax=Myxine glutinosa TaxID=7769 RepID=UPI00358F8700